MLNVVEELYRACNTERERGRERERGHCLHLVTVAACGKGGSARGCYPCTSTVVFLSYSVFCSPWAVVVFPTIVGFPLYILCLNFVSLFSAYFVHTPSFRLWPKKLGNRILTATTSLTHSLSLCVTRSVQLFYNIQQPYALQLKICALSHIYTHMTLRHIYICVLPIGRNRSGPVLR